MINYPALKTEVQSDPNGYGYAAPLATGTYWQVADLLNTVRATIHVDRDLVAAHEVYEAIVPAEWSALTADEKQRVSTLLGMGEINAKGTNTRASFAAAFGAGTTTRTNLVALQTRDGSRAEQLFGAGTVIRPEDITTAMGS